MAASGVLYGLAGRHPWLLLLVNAGLVLNWLGDSLDGTLARYRRRRAAAVRLLRRSPRGRLRRPLRSGGLALSGLMSPLVAAGLLVAYYLLAIETYLATYAIGRFKISWGPVGGTELRIVLAAVNGLVFCGPGCSSAGRRGSSSTSWAWVRPRPSASSPSWPGSGEPGRWRSTKGGRRHSGPRTCRRSDAAFIARRGGSALAGLAENGLS